MTPLRLVASIATHEFVVNVRRPGFIIFTLLIPALGLVGLLIAGLFSGQAAQLFESQFSRSPQPVGIVDHTGLFTPIPPVYTDRYIAMPAETEARQALMANDIGSYVVIPADYVQTGRVTAYTSGGLLEAVGAADSSSLRAFLVHGLLAGQVDEPILRRATNPAEITPVRLDEQGRPTGADDVSSAVAGIVVPYALSIFLIISIFTASSYLLRSVAEEKESRVIEVVLSSVTAAQLLAGKVLGLGALGLTQVAVWLASAFLLSGGLAAALAGVIIALNPGVFALATLYFILGYLLYGTLMAAAGALGSNVRESQQLAGIFSFAAAVPLMFNSLIIAAPNASLVRVLSYFPLTAPTVMMLRLPMAPIPLVDILGSVVILVLAILFVIWAGARVFRLGLLMYGKRPGLRQIWQGLRSA
jgi:ABC-2 type transport system permease protein